MKIISKLTDAPVLTAVMVPLGLIYLWFFISPPPLISPDEVSYRFFARRLARENTIFYRPPGDRLMGVKGFLPRAFHYNVRGEVVPRKPPGLIFLWAAYEKLVGPRFSATLFPLLAGGVLFLFYLFTARIFADRRIRAAATLLLASMPVFLLRSHAYSPTMLNLAVFLILILIIDRMLDRGRWYYYPSAGMVMGLLVPPAF